jgi:hypothetical protein
MSEHLMPGMRMYAGASSQSVVIEKSAFAEHAGNANVYCRFGGSKTNVFGPAPARQKNSLIH